MGMSYLSASSHACCQRALAERASHRGWKPAADAMSVEGVLARQSGDAFTLHHVVETDGTGIGQVFLRFRGLQMTPQGLQRNVRTSISSSFSQRGILHSLEHCHKVCTQAMRVGARTQSTLRIKTGVGPPAAGTLYDFTSDPASAARAAGIATSRSATRSTRANFASAREALTRSKRFRT
mmetsp:Transcript_44656/g.78533  ORF Transcript_44656/g.78533 Transcript_44656/m.78533 type:complete len:180 (-) Transcript_44656:345-884(-)